jgi:hypothetical protein
MKFRQVALLALTALTSSSVNAFIAHAKKLHHSASFVSETSLNMGMFSELFQNKESEGPDKFIPPPEEISEGQVRGLFYLWNDALATGDSSIVAKLYAEDSPLLFFYWPTVSDEPRTDYESIKDYFDNFLELEPQAHIIDGKVKIGQSWAKDSGIYEFTGAMREKVRAWYSFIYIFENGQWRILQHHSLAMPEASKEKKEEKVVEEKAVVA